jgi:hypothetical protein
VLVDTEACGRVGYYQAVKVSEVCIRREGSNQELGADLGGEARRRAGMAGDVSIRTMSRMKGYDWTYSAIETKHPIRPHDVHEHAEHSF